MRVVAKTGREDVALVYVAETGERKFVEFAESLQPPLPKEKKWVLTISTLHGCPVGCRFCDAGGFYQGKLSKDQILSQIDYLVKSQFPDGNVPVEKFKIQFARTGEPSFNQAVLDVLECLPERYHAPGLIPSISTVAPHGTDRFFERLLSIKKRIYGQKFQFQYSIHTTDESIRDWLIPVRKWTFEKMAEYAHGFYEEGDRKITLNFALAEELPVVPEILLKHFGPDRFLIKVTPVNPTYQATKNNVSSLLPDQRGYTVVDALRAAGYHVILSIGEIEENYIGSNCGQYITAYQQAHASVKDGYTYSLQQLGDGA
jgi:23S rRNA (adenine2503-C2)-methyltransferase